MKLVLKQLTGRILPCLLSASLLFSPSLSAQDEQSDETAAPTETTQDQTSGSAPHIIYTFAGNELSLQDAQQLTEKLKGTLEEASRAPYVIAEEWDNGTLPATCDSRDAAEQIKANAHAAELIWGTVGSLGNIFLCSVYRLSGETGATTYEVFQEEVGGGLQEVLKYCIFNIAMKMTGQHDKLLEKPMVPYTPAPVAAAPMQAQPPVTTTVQTTQTVAPAQQPSTVVTTSTVGRGWLKISVEDDETRLFLDGEPIGKGSCEVEAPAGGHRITASVDDESESRFIEISPNERTTISFGEIEGDDDDDDDGKDQRVARVFVSGTATWAILESPVEFGPQLTVGVELKKKNLLAFNFYWGLDIDDGKLFGGGFNYMFSFNIADIFIARLGACAGFYYERSYGYYYDYYSYDEYYSHDEFYIGGPKIRLEIGYKHVYYTILDMTLLLGSGDPKGFLGNGISFRF